MYDVAYSVIRYTQQTIGNGCHLLHDNLFEHWYATVHPNLYECVSEPSNSSGAFYNNVFRYICTDTNACPIGGLVGFWPAPPTSTTDYWFNNISYSQNPSIAFQYFDVGQNNENQGPLDVFNNIFESTSNGNIYGCTSGYTYQLNITNNLYITDSGTQGICSGKTTSIAELLMTHATATADGYTASETYAYSPPSASSPTVGAGTNEGTINNAYCSALATAAASDSTLNDAATACLSDTRYACTYNSSAHTVTCPARTAATRPTSAAWDIGAYQDPSAPPQPPTNVQATAH
jgi:hypothetical protein